FRAGHGRLQLGTPQLMPVLRDARLPETDQELRDFLRLAAVGLCWVGADGRVLWANKAELDLVGDSEPEYVGRHVAAFWVEPEALAGTLEPRARNERVQSYETRVRSKDGSVKHVLLDGSALFRDGR